MVGRGRSEDTADLYVSHLRHCADDPKGLMHRLVGKKLSPNTRRTIKASLAAWAVYTKDGELAAELKDIKLPPARRITPKVPHPLEEWKRYVTHLKTCPIRMRDKTRKVAELKEHGEHLRQVMLLIAIRGMRCGDVLRIQRVDVVKSLESGVLSYIGKGDKRMEISATPLRAQLEYLAEVPGWKRLSDLVSSGKRRAASRKIQRQLISTARKCGIKNVYPHRFRHTFATRFLEQLKGDPNALVKLQRFMGWESIATAARYVDHVSQEQLDTIGAGVVAGLLTP